MKTRHLKPSVVQEPVRFGTGYLLVSMTGMAILLTLFLRLKIPGAIGHAMVGMLLLAAAGLGRHAVLRLFHHTGKFCAVSLLSIAVGAIMGGGIARLLGLAELGSARAVFIGGGVCCAVAILAAYPFPTRS